MRFILLIFLQLLFFSGYSFGESEESYELDITSTGDIINLLCRAENKEISEILVECFDVMNIAEHESMVKECYGGWDGEVSGQGLKKWYCSNSPEDGAQADQCTFEKIKAEKGEEKFDEMINTMTDCIEEKLSSEERKK